MLLFRQTFLSASIFLSTVPAVISAQQETTKNTNPAIIEQLVIAPNEQDTIESDFESPVASDSTDRLVSSPTPESRYDELANDETKRQTLATSDKRTPSPHPPLVDFKTNDVEKDADSSDLTAEQQNDHSTDTNTLTPLAVGCTRLSADPTNAGEENCINEHYGTSLEKQDNVKIQDDGAFVRLDD